MSVNQLLDATINSDVLQITIGRKTLLNFLTTSEQWPVSEYTDKALKIIDKPAFLEELIAHMLEEDRNGVTVIHSAIENAMVNLVNSGTSAIEEDVPPEEKDEDGGFGFGGDDDDDY